MKDKGDIFMWACFLISLAFLQAGALFDSRLIKKLESRCKANEEAIALLYCSMQTNKVVVEAFMMAFNSQKEQQEKVNVAIADAITIAFKNFAEQKGGSQ